MFPLNILVFEIHYQAVSMLSLLCQLTWNEYFLKLFCDKGPMSAYVEKIPVHIITSDMPALMGAAIAPVD